MIIFSAYVLLSCSISKLKDWLLSAVPGVSTQDTHSCNSCLKASSPSAASKFLITWWKGNIHFVRITEVIFTPKIPCYSHFCSSSATCSLSPTNTLQ